MGTVIVCVFKSITTLSDTFLDEKVLGTNSSSLIKSIVSCVAGSSSISTDVKLCVIGGGGGVGTLVDFLCLSTVRSTLAECIIHFIAMNLPLETFTSLTDDDECSEYDDVVVDDSDDDERLLLRSCELPLCDRCFSGVTDR